MSGMIGGFGEVVFQVSADVVKTFEALARKSRAVYADHEVVIGKPASEFTGMDLDETSFQMILNATLGVSPEREVEALREMQATGKAHLLTIGDKPRGYFTIREIGDAVTHTLRGAPIIMTVDVTLKEYEEKLPGAGSEAAARDAATRGETGVGGPEKIPNAGQPMRSRECRPCPDNG